jgi:hypothetical protein
MFYQTRGNCEVRPPLIWSDFVPVSASLGRPALAPEAGTKGWMPINRPINRQSIDRRVSGSFKLTQQVGPLPLGSRSETRLDRRAALVADSVTR